MYVSVHEGDVVACDTHAWGVHFSAPVEEVKRRGLVMTFAADTLVELGSDLRDVGPMMVLSVRSAGNQRNHVENSGGAAVTGLVVGTANNLNREGSVRGYLFTPQTPAPDFLDALNYQLAALVGVQVGKVAPLNGRLARLLEAVRDRVGSSTREAMELVTRLGAMALKMQGGRPAGPEEALVRTLETLSDDLLGKLLSPN